MAQTGLRWLQAVTDDWHIFATAEGPDGGARQMIILGVILLVLGLVLKITILYTIGIVILVVGVVFLILGATGRAVGGRKYWF